MFKDPTQPPPPPRNARYRVLHPDLGPWERGSVLSARADLDGADIAALLALRAIEPTDEPRDVRLRDKPRKGE